VLYRKIKEKNEISGTEKLKKMFYRRVKKTGI
jgi:hypothetical protein